MGKRASSFIASDDGSGDERPAKVSKKATKGAASSSSGAAGDANGDAFWELGKSARRVTVSKYSGKYLVSIREYYEDKSSGEMKPGKKGISLSVEQYQALLGVVPAINEQLRQNGVALEGDVIEDEDGEEEEEEEVVKPVKASKKPKKTKVQAKKKANIDATSDEGEDEE